MSDTDSFIDEVSEEVRRDRLFKLMRKWGWLPISLVVLLVGGAAYNEWAKARSQSIAEVLGTEILSAVQIEDAAERNLAYGAIASDGESAALLALLSAGDAVEDGEQAQAVATLSTLADDTSISDKYRHLAEFKLLLADAENIEAPERISRFQAIANPGAPYRLLAEEQIALIEISTGDTDAGLERLRIILSDDELTIGLRRRASQLVVALGGELVPS